MTVPGLRKAIAIAVVTVLTEACGTWTDDGGYQRTLTVRGNWSPQATALPQVTVHAELGQRLHMPAGMVVALRNWQPGTTPQPVRGGIIDPVRVICDVRTRSEDEREQVSDLLDSALYTGLNSAGVPWMDVLTGYGLDLLLAAPDSFSEIQQEDDTAHAPVVYRNRIVYPFRVQVQVVPTVQPVTTITLKNTLVVPST